MQSVAVVVFCSLPILRSWWIKVRFNSVQYNIRDLESKIYVPERNKLIVDTWMQYVRNKRTVVFCASVKHAEQIAAMFREQGIHAAAVSGSMKKSERMEFQERFVNREIQVLCVCDLLNEGWDCACKLPNSGKRLRVHLMRELSE